MATKIKGMDLIETLAADLNKTEAEAVARRAARDGQPAPVSTILAAAQAEATRPPAREDQPAAMSPKNAALSALPAEWREQLVISASEMGIKAEDDLGWLLVGAFVNAWAGAAAAGKSAEAVQASVGKIQGEVLAGARAAGKDVAQEIEAAGKRVNDGISQHLTAPDTGILASIKTALEAGAGQGLKSTRDDLRQVHAEASAIIDALPEKVRQAIDTAERVSAESFSQTAQATLDRFAQQKSKFWMVFGGIFGLFMEAAGIGYGYIMGSGSFQWWPHNSLWSSIFFAPLGIVLFPIAGFAVIEGGKGYPEYSRMRPALIWIGVSLAVSGLVLPILGHYVH